MHQCSDSYSACSCDKECQKQLQVKRVLKVILHLLQPVKLADQSPQSGSKMKTFIIILFCIGVTVSSTILKINERKRRMFLTPTGNILLILVKTVSFVCLWYCRSKDISRRLSPLTGFSG